MLLLSSKNQLCIQDKEKTCLERIIACFHGDYLELMSWYLLKSFTD